MEDLRENLSVIVRIRPLTSQQSQACLQTKQNSITIAAKPDPKHFSFDFIAGPQTTQTQFFSQVGLPISQSCLKGFNGTIFAYGQTGAGKTYTMQGKQELWQSSQLNWGLIQRSFDYIFSKIQTSFDRKYSIKCSFFQIYQQQVIDLLSPIQNFLQVRQDLNKGTYVQGLSERIVKDAKSTFQALLEGSKNRHTGETSMNKVSSRSHSVFTLYIESEKERNGVMSQRSSKYHLIDLAGSQRQKPDDCGGERLREAGIINKSLSALGNVINSLADIAQGKSRYIHYRDSKLTFILRDSLGGNSKTSVVANISPSIEAIAQTISTLKFAARAKFIKNKAVINEESQQIVHSLQERIKYLTQELSYAKSFLKNPVDCSGCESLRRLLQTDNQKIMSLESKLHQKTQEKNVIQDYFLNKLQQQTELIEKLQITLQELQQRGKIQPYQISLQENSKPTSPQLSIVQQHTRDVHENVTLEFSIDFNSSISKYTPQLLADKENLILQLADSQDKVQVLLGQVSNLSEKVFDQQAQITNLHLENSKLQDLNSCVKTKLEIAEKQKLKALQEVTQVLAQKEQEQELSGLKTCESSLLKVKQEYWKQQRTFQSGSSKQYSRREQSKDTDCTLSQNQNIILKQTLEIQQLKQEIKKQRAIIDELKHEGQEQDIQEQLSQIFLIPPSNQQNLTQLQSFISVNYQSFRDQSVDLLAEQILNINSKADD